MRWTLYFVAAALVAASAFWAYRVNYDAKAAQDQAAALRAELAREREAIAVLRAEWAWLSAPERVRALVAANADALALAPIGGAAFVDLDELPAPPPEAFWARADPSLLAAIAEGRP